MSPCAEFRFYAGLNDLLKPAFRNQPIVYPFDESPGIKDPIEALGVPHTEVEAIVVNGTSVDFSYRLQDGDRVSVYSRSYKVDVSPLKKLRPPLETPAFVLDVHLGKLARLLRLLGMDTWYRNDYDDPELVEICAGEGRVLLTRDRRLLFHRRIIYGCFILHDAPMEQALEVIKRYRLHAFIKPFSRCARCNGVVTAVKKGDILAELEPRTIRYYNQFYRCCSCGQIYWRGSHFAGLVEKLRSLGAS